MRKKVLLICFTAVLLLVTAACVPENGRKADAIEKIDGIVMYDAAVGLPRLAVKMSDGGIENVDYSEFWFSGEHVYVQNGKVYVKDGAPNEFNDILTVTLKSDENIRQTVDVEKRFIPLQSVQISGSDGKTACIVGESLPLEIALTPSNASNKNVTLIADAENAEIRNNVLYLPKDFPDGIAVVITARADGIVYGTAEIASKKRTEISSVADLAAIEKDPNGDYILTADIGFGADSAGFPIPYFGGTLDGNGHAVSGLALKFGGEKFDAEKNIGLFGELSGKVYNFSLNNFDIDCGEYQGGAAVNAGILAGKSDGAVITDVSVSGVLRVKRYLSRAGGLTGYASGVSVKNCEAAVEIHAGGDAGGIVGYVRNSEIKNAAVENSKIEIYINTANKTAGGIAGNAADTLIDGARLDGASIKIAGIEHISPETVQPVIGLIAGQLSAGGIVGLPADGGIINSRIETDILNSFGGGQYPNRLVFIGNGINESYGKSINDAIILTDAESITVYVYDGDSVRSDDNKYGGHRHTKERSIGLDIDRLKEKGRKTIKITMEFQIRAQDKGDGRSIWLDLDGKRVFLKENLNVNKEEWYTVKYEVTVPIDSFTTYTKFRIGLETKAYAFTDAVWWFNTAYVTFEAQR
ncbi:MAG: hypothetical protein LBP62_04895 [Clostridiales bacterium]|jgi:hypothetical protein|nr:hypothetical protein [Clostridiales bacterium]